MIKKLISLLPLITFLILSSNTLAQKAPVKWGDIPEEDLEMTVYDKDPEAAAVVLADYGEWTFEVLAQELKLIYKRHRRVKILSDQGFDQADVEILYAGNGRNEKLIKLKAQIISSDGQKTILTKKDFFEEDLDRIRVRKRFTFPNVEAGSVLEYVYEIESENWFFLYDWYFQDEIPVRWSELIFTRPQMFEYSVSVQGSLPFYVVDTESFFNTITGSGFNRYVENNPQLKMLRTRYVVKNAVALKEEPFITTLKDYLTKINFQIKRVIRPSGIVDNVFTSWSDFAKELNAMGGLGKRLVGKNLKHAGEVVLSHDGSPEGIMAAAFRFVTKNVSWNGSKKIYSDYSLKEALENGEGNSADLNLMLIALLKANGLNAFPALISTRSHGKMMPFFPMIDQFNYLMAYVETEEDKAFFMDATDPLRACTIPDKNCLNRQAWIIVDDKHRWVDLVPKKSKQVISAQINLLDDGNATGSIDFSLSMYDAFNGRKEIDKSSKEDFLKNYLIDNENVEVESFEIENLDAPNEKLNVRIKCTIPEFGMSSGDLIYINPVFLDFYDENPFELEERTYPVDIPYPFNKTFLLTLTLPKGYGIEELPQNEIIKLPENGGRFQFLCQQMPGKLQLISKMDLDQVYFTPENYMYIKAFFDKIVEKQSEQIVLKKLP